MRMDADFCQGAHHNNELSVQRAARPNRLLKESEVSGERVDVIDAGVFPLLAGDLFDAAQGDPCGLGDVGPCALARLELLKNVFVNGTCHSP